MEHKQDKKKFALLRKKWLLIVVTSIWLFIMMHGLTFMIGMKQLYYLAFFVDMIVLIAAVVFFILKKQRPETCNTLMTAVLFFVLSELFFIAPFYALSPKSAIISGICCEFVALPINLLMFFCSKSSQNRKYSSKQSSSFGLAGSLGVLLFFITRFVLTVTGVVYNLKFVLLVFELCHTCTAFFRNWCIIKLFQSTKK